MADRFFHQQTCDRCGGSLTGGRTMSMFSTECICMKCSEEEHRHPDCRKASDAEQEAIRNGNHNFPGIGWPGKKGGAK